MRAQIRIRKEGLGVFFTTPKKKKRETGSNLQHSIGDEHDTDHDNVDEKSTSHQKNVGSDELAVFLKTLAKKDLLDNVDEVELKAHIEEDDKRNFDWIPNVVDFDIDFTDFHSSRDPDQDNRDIDEKQEDKEEDLQSEHELLVGSNNCQSIKNNLHDEMDLKSPEDDLNE